MYKSGYVNIIGNPNVGKSTLMNALVGEKMSIITAKPQTTRHRIIGILNGEDFQIVFSDTPGIIKNPAYKMQVAMNRFVRTTFEDADLMLFVTEVNEKYKDDDPIFEDLKKLNVPKFLIINKTDISEDDKIIQLIKWWNDRVDFNETIPISALKKRNTEKILKLIFENIKEGPAYFPKDQLTDRPEKFFVGEIVREKILELYHQEIPYSAEVYVERFKETTTKRGEAMTDILAYIFVARETQKMILLGKNGSAIKRLSTSSRISLEKYLEKKVFLDLHVKVKKNWRDDDRQLRQFGYE